MTTEILLKLFSDSHRDLNEVVTPIPDERFAQQPFGLPNHPAWTLAHVCVANDFTLHVLGKPTQCPAHWADVAAPGTKPAADRSAYAPKDELLAMLASQHEAVAVAVRGATSADFERESPENIRSFAPTVGHVVAYMLAAHESYHLAQLQDWRRLAGITA